MKPDHVDSPSLSSAAPSPPSPSLVTPNSISGAEKSKKENRSGSFGDGPGISFSPAVSVDESSHHSNDDAVNQPLSAASANNNNRSRNSNSNSNESTGEGPAVFHL